MILNFKSNLERTYTIYCIYILYTLYRYTYIDLIFGIYDGFICAVGIYYQGRSVHAETHRRGNHFLL